MLTAINRYSPEPARGHYQDLGFTVTHQAELAAHCLFFSGRLDGKTAAPEFVADALYGATFMVPDGHPDMAFLRFLSETAILHIG